jgi:pimeloyl-ACP methyl ester carboxylesterase
VSRTKRNVGLVGAAVGVAAAGLATAFAVERALVRRTQRKGADPYADERFGDQPYDKSLTVTAADGTDLHVEIVEPREDAGLPPVLFVHGFCLDMGTFYFQRTVLAERGDRRLIFYDQPGHGRSGRLESGEYDLAALGESLRAVIEATVPQGPVVLVGHSMGGMTIMAFAEKYPTWFGDRVQGAVLMATSGGLVEKTKIGIPALVAKASAPLLPLVNGAARLSGGTIDKARAASGDLAWLLTRRYGFGEPNPSPRLVSFVEAMNSKTSAETVAKYLRTLYTHARYPALAALRETPTLVLVGTKDYITPLTHSEEILKHLPDAEFAKIENSGHVVMLEHADEVNEILLNFLEKVR